MTKTARNHSEHAELEQTMRMFTSITRSLRSGYATLTERAERVEKELVLVNNELERKVAELDEVKRHLEAVLQALPTGVVVRDEAGRITRLNAAARSILGSESPAEVESVLCSAGSGEGDTRSSFELVRPDGQRRVLSSDCSPFFGPEGTLLGSVQILADQTEVTRLSERLHAVDKLAALGTMAGGIAHEIRNPLNAVQGFANLLLGSVGKDAPEHRWAARIVEGSEEANAIIQSMLSFALPQKLQLEAIDAEELVKCVLTAVLPQSDAPPQWAVTWKCDAVRFTGDRIKLRQALRNLVANAIEAQPGGGEVDVSLRREGGDVVIRVNDAGPGVQRDLRHRILDPFFTTRAEGTGLGLALTQTIAQLHGGEVDVSSEPGALGGAEVSIRIPLIPADSPDPCRLP